MCPHCGAPAERSALRRSVIGGLVAGAVLLSGCPVAAYGPPPFNPDLTMKPADMCAADSGCADAGTADAQ